MSIDASAKNKLFDKVVWLTQYPDNEAKQFMCYAINGVKFHTKDSGQLGKLKTMEFVLLLKVVLLIMVY